MLYMAEIGMYRRLLRQRSDLIYLDIIMGHAHMLKNKRWDRIIYPPQLAFSKKTRHILRNLSSMRTFDIKPITEKLLWGKVLAGISHFSFLQDWQWGEVEQALGRYVIRLGIYEHHDLVGVCQMVGYRAKKGNFL